ncbi:hypothetical protein EZZ80_08255 [Pseudomonas putida]|nr:hypothetical protein DM483_22830 [Pseudomonas sp. SMT-1]QDW57266.1 hypothetical protein FFH79_010480 [Pseudomonas sp. KBS0802]UZA73486.1 hypothetical protein EZZ80_08255 [Pseudomonas putida]
MDSTQRSKLPRSTCRPAGLLSNTDFTGWPWRQGQTGNQPPGGQHVHDRRRDEDPKARARDHHQRRHQR